MALTPAELTILGLVIERPAHGYDLERIIEQRGIRQWTDLGFSSIYYLLAKLKQRGLIEVARNPAGPRSRRVFRATSAGRELATQSTLALIADARPVPHPFLVGVANLPLLTRSEYSEALRVRLAQLEARIAVAEEAERSQAPLPPSASEVFSFALTLMKTERKWLAARVQVRHDDQD